SGSFVVAVDTDVMGRGSEELGKTLMKGFLFAVSQLPSLPKTVLFYNGGAHLTCQGSASLEDINALADKGVDIRTCGTCLNFYGLTDKLEVGSVTNMYEIVETLAQAGKVVKP
ncbi:sulfurtransferase-like selenium metabolism protein YedF, partial [Oscillibacter sp. UBA6647]